MKKTIKLEGLDCAHCAAKIEKKVSGMKGVDSCSVNFLTAKMILEVEELSDEMFNEIKKVVNKFEPDVEVKLI